MTIAVRPDIVTSLGVIRGNVVHHLVGISRYRALRNIEQTMADIAEFQDLVTPLRDVREQIERQLQETKEYRALCAIDSIVPQLADVLAFLDEKSSAEAPSPNTHESAAAEPDPETHSDIQILAVYARADETAPAEDVGKFVDGEHLASEPQDLIIDPEIGDTERSLVRSEQVPDVSDASFTVARDDMSDDVVFGPSQIPVTADRNPPASDDSSEESASPPVATLAYNLANMLVQSLPPSASDAKSAPADSQIGSATTTDADHAAQEGRAA